MDHQLFWLDSLFFIAISDEMLCQYGLFTVRNHPSDDITAVDVENNIQIEIGPLCRPLEFCYIP